MEDLKKYLETESVSRDYHEGVKLYKKYGNDIRFKNVTLVNGSKIAAVKSKLQYELEKIYQTSSGKVIVQPKKEAPKTKTVVLVERPENGLKGALKKEFPNINFLILPDELAALIPRRIGLFNQAKDARIALFNADLTDEQRTLLAKTNIESRIENLKIWSELNYYNEHNEVLGKHPIFERSNALKNLQELDRKQLLNLVNQTASYVSKNNALLEKAKTEGNAERENEISERIAFRQWQCDEANKLLGTK
jgi:hypothetical protein